MDSGFRYAAQAAAPLRRNDGGGMTGGEWRGGGNGNGWVGVLGLG